MFGKHAWMCSICGQGLTRKSSATRHNNNLHLGEAVIVRPIEYVIRRLNNQFSSPRDPLSFRRNNTSHNDKSRRTITNQVVGPNYSHENNNDDNNDFLINNKVGFKNESFSKQDMGSANLEAVRRQIGIASPPTPPSLLQQQNQHVKNNDDDNKIPTMSPLSSPSYTQPVIHYSLLKDQQQPLQKNAANNDNKTDDKWLERNSKLEELIKLVRKNYSYEYAQQISTVVKMQLIMFEDDNFLDQTLAQVRGVDRIRSAS
jgi:hypothetical protein